MHCEPEGEGSKERDTRVEQACSGLSRWKKKTLSRKTEQHTPRPREVQARCLQTSERNQLWLERSENGKTDH